MITEDNEICSLDNYCALPASSLLIWGQSLPYPLYIRLGATKLIKVVNADDDYFDTIKRLSEKGIKSVWLERDAFDPVTKCIQSCVTSLIERRDDERYEVIFSELNACYEVLRGIIASTGLKEEHIEMTRDISISCLNIIKEHRSYLTLFARLSENCSKSFLRCVFTGYISTRMISSFEWSSKELIEESMTAAMLSDVLLDSEQLREHSDWEEGTVEFEYLSDKVKTHGDLMALKIESMGRSRLSDEVIQSIRYHHYDCSINPDVTVDMMNKVSILPAIYVIARKTIMVIEKEGEIFDRTEFINKLWALYDVSCYKHAISSLGTLWASS